METGMNFARLRLLLIAVMAGWIALAAPAQAEPEQYLGEAVADRASDVAEVLRRRRPSEGIFAPSFLAAIPEAQLLALVDQISAANGPVTGADEVKVTGATSGSFLLRFERATAKVLIYIEPDPPHRVAGLRITSITPFDDGPMKLLADFSALPGQTAFGLYRLGANGPEPRLTKNPAKQLAIGSTFKLWVLDAVAEEVAAGRLRWDQVTPLGKRSFPSGITQDWPENTPATVETLAILMISISDNTATDTLMHLVGREKLAARVIASGHAAPERMLPMLTTREAFTLKAQVPERIAAYAAADRAERIRILDALQPAGRVTMSSKPASIETIEWFASPDDIAGVLDSLRRRDDPRVLAIFGVAPHVAPDTAARFAKVGYKGGSESGVLSLSWLLQGKDGQWFVATASWNDPDKPVDAQRFELLAMRLIGLSK
jgi:hypothetical protein